MAAEATFTHPPAETATAAEVSDSKKSLRIVPEYGTIFPVKTKYYVIKEKAVPEVLLKVIEAKRLMDMQELTVQQATEKAGISRSSFYKYKDDILPFHDNAKGKTITFILQMDDEPGLLSDVLKIIAEFHGNILTIHQTIPLNGVASLTISVDIAEDRGDASEMINEIESRQGVHYFKILGQES